MDWSEMIYQDWSGLVRTVIVGTLAYAALVAALRASGKRTLAKLNAFDLVVTVALGSTLSAILLNESIALAEGLVALGLLIGLQYAVAFFSVRSKGFAQLVRSEPSLLMRRGTPLPAALRQARITRSELDSVIRTHGSQNRDAVASVILESDGSFSVILEQDGQRVTPLPTTDFDPPSATDPAPKAG
ncbi:MAG TPA: DUF421 domain-containing protein [Citreicella sp.]|jgi:uncharacterized membrane protein YcaP (DUF421 family)|nr:DUF421 domain-containing protein [Citreicella sp.]|tara:strand:- start:148 stop:708 length:561 start_codon:yes stop_codon:yes gene_type:complete